MPLAGRLITVAPGISMTQQSYDVMLRAGWTPPPEPPKPKEYRVRVVKWTYGDATAFSAYPPEKFDGVNLGGVAASVIVTLTEGVFDAEWTK